MKIDGRREKGLSARGSTSLVLFAVRRAGRNENVDGNPRSGAKFSYRYLILELRRMFWWNEKAGKTRNKCFIF